MIESVGVVIVLYSIFLSSNRTPIIIFNIPQLLVLHFDFNLNGRHLCSSLRLNFIKLFTWISQWRTDCGKLKNNTDIRKIGSGNAE